MSKQKHFFQRFIIVVFMIISWQSQAQDFDVIYKRMYESFLKNPSSGAVKSVLSKMKSNGSFSDIKYSGRNNLMKHLERINQLASAYKNSSSSYHNKSEVKMKYFAGLQYWVDKNYKTNNWINRWINFPHSCGRGFLLMSKELKSEKNVLYKKSIRYLRWSYEQNRGIWMTGFNGAAIAMTALPAAIADKNAEHTENLKNFMTLLTQYRKPNDGYPQIGDGLQPDDMFGQHDIKGRQLYMLRYGYEYFQEVLPYIKYTQGTKYELKDLSKLEKVILNSTQWCFYNKNYDPHLTGRFNNSDQYFKIVKNMMDDFIALNPPQKTALQEARNRMLNGVNSLSGNKMFWRFDYMLHRRSNYMVSSRMTSDRTGGSEAGGGSGNFNYYSGNGVNYIFHKGNEYGKDYFRKFNKRQFPGITAEQDSGNLPIPTWGKHGINGNAYAGGTSDGTYGVSGMILSKRGVTAHKSWFYFDKEFVALGAGIKKSGGSNVYSNLNQCHKSGTPTYSRNGSVSSISGTKTLDNPDWILHGDIGYFNLDTSSKIVVSTSNNLFSANVNHGSSPNGKTYAYAVRPGTESSGAATTFSKNIPVTIESNTETIQAVRHKELKITQVVFYKPGILTLSTGTQIQVDKECVLLLNEREEKVSVASPFGEDTPYGTLRASIVLEGKTSNLSFQMPKGMLGGKTVSSNLTDGGGDICLPVYASSDNNGSIAENTLDNDLSTRWSAEGDGQYIEYCLEEVIDLNTVSIAFHKGDVRTATFDLSVSEDGENYRTVLSKQNSSGNTLGLQKFIFEPIAAKKIRITGYGNSENAWNSITEVKWNSSVTPPTTEDCDQSVIASSYQTGNTPGNTLDNDLSTRWSAEGDGEYIEYCLDEITVLNSVSIAFQNGNARMATFDLSVSEDGMVFQTVLSRQVSSGKTTALQEFSFAPVRAKKIRITGYGNSENTWNSITEVEWNTFGARNVRIPGKEVTAYSDTTGGQATISGLEKGDQIKIYTMTGQYVLSQKATSDIVFLQLDGLPQGLYIVQINTQKTLKIIKN